MGSFWSKNRVDPTNPDYDTEHSSSVVTMKPCLRCHKQTSNRQRLPPNKSIPICESCLTKKECQKCHKDSITLLRSPCRKICCICCECMMKHMVKPKTATDIYFRCPICNQKMDLPRQDMYYLIWNLTVVMVAELTDGVFDDIPKYVNIDGSPLADRVMLIYQRQATSEEERSGDHSSVTDMYQINPTYANTNKAVIGAASLPNNDIVVLSQLNNQSQCEVLLYDSSLNKISEKSFSNQENSAWGLCHLEDRKIAVSIPKQNLIYILSMYGTIHIEQEIRTRLQCYCLANLNANELVATGFNDSTKQYYRCTIWTASAMTLCCTKDAGDCYCKEVANEDNVYELGPGKVNYIAVNNGKNRVYLSCESSDSVDCCKIRGSKTFFTYKHEHLQSPRGVGVDSNDILYIVGYGSNNLHLVTPAGKPLKIIANHIPEHPDVIVFNQGKNQFFLSAGWPREASCFIRITTTDLLKE